MKKIYKIFASFLCVSIAIVMTVTLYLQNTMPSNYRVTKGEKLCVNSVFNVITKAPDNINIKSAYACNQKDYKAQLKLFGFINIKNVDVQVVDNRLVVPCGTPFGIKMFTDGVMVVGLGDMNVGGLKTNPSKEAGIKMGDIIIDMNNQKVYSNEDVRGVIEKSDGKPVSVNIKRNKKKMKLTLKPVRSPIDNRFKAGLWVRDSSAGIGTMTFYDPNTKNFAGLGHGICDIDTGNIMPLYQGEIVRAAITGINCGKAGNPGELCGMLLETGSLGDLYKNTEEGVYGKLKRVPILANPISVAHIHEIKKGEATILTTIKGEKPKEYKIEIESINYDKAKQFKNMVISITDKELLQKAGGIVQGMSGSPIIQNGKLIGAVTHVFVNEQTKGYGIFAENMDNMMKSVTSCKKIACNN